VLKSLPDHCIDLLLVDPPYNISQKGMEITRANSPSHRFQGRNIHYDFGVWDRLPADKYEDFMQSWIQEAIRVLKENANFVSFIAKENVSKLHSFMLSKGFKYRNILCWVKSNPVPHLRKVNFASAVEFIYWCSRGKNTFNWQLGHSPNYFKSPLCQGIERLEHPTQKPEALISWLVKYLSNKDDLVLDCMCGSGTTLSVAQKLGREWIGIEINPKYCELARKRLTPLVANKHLEEFIKP